MSPSSNWPGHHPSKLVYTGSSPVGDTMIKNGEIMFTGLIAQNNETGHYIHRKLESYLPIPGERLRLVRSRNFNDAKVFSSMEEWKNFLGEDFSSFVFAKVNLVARLEIV